VLCHLLYDTTTPVYFQASSYLDKIQVLTFPDVLIPLARDAYTITQARKRQKARGHLISPGYSIPAEIFSTKYLRIRKREGKEGRRKEEERQRTVYRL
jgi:hypothetical protein